MNEKPDAWETLRAELIRDSVLWTDSVDGLTYLLGLFDRHAAAGRAEVARAEHMSGVHRQTALDLTAELDSLRAMLDAPPAQMSYAGRLVTIDSTGLREVIDEAMALRAELERLRAPVEDAELAEPPWHSEEYTAALNEQLDKIGTLARAVQERDELKQEVRRLRAPVGEGELAELRRLGKRWVSTLNDPCYCRDIPDEDQMICRPCSSQQDLRAALASEGGEKGGVDETNR